MNSMTETNRITKTDPVPLADCVKTLAIEYVPSIDQSVLYFGNNQMLYVSMTPEEIKEHRPKVVFVDGSNKIAGYAECEKHGEIK